MTFSNGVFTAKGTQLVLWRSLGTEVLALLWCSNPFGSAALLSDTYDVFVLPYGNNHVVSYFALVLNREVDYLSSSSFWSPIRCVGQVGRTHSCEPFARVGYRILNASVISLIEHLVINRFGIAPFVLACISVNSRLECAFVLEQCLVMPQVAGTSAKDEAQN